MHLFGGRISVVGALATNNAQDFLAAMLLLLGYTSILASPVLYADSRSTGSF